MARNQKKQNNRKGRPFRGSNNYSYSSASSVDKNLEKRDLYLPEIVSVKDFADRAQLPVTKIISELIKNGVLATINETIDFDTASIIGDDLGLNILPEEAKTASQTKETQVAVSQNLIPRAPIVTIMGHVDHGKTSLLDKIREASVASTESGGITQHISAYQVTLQDTKNKDLKNRTITFIDTPGHAAFSAMREHGAAITDIVVLIVAADDGVMPQTIEVIQEAKSNNVPIIIAINKVDLPDADIMKVKQQLTEYELVPEDWGGTTVMVEVSAKTGVGVDNLLEMILLQADMMELKADPDQMATGVVIESKMSKGMGATALVLIENGTLKKGDPVAIGSAYGRIRIMEDYKHVPIELAGPSFPVRIAGLKSIPNFGDRLLVFTNEKEAKDNALRYKKSEPTVHIATAKKMAEKEEGVEKESVNLNLIIKCDVRGSLDAVRKSIEEIKSQEAVVKIISEGVGPISESDITLAKATGATVLGFRVKELGAAKKIAEKDEVKIETFSVIYELVDYIKLVLSDLLPAEVIETQLGVGKVLAIFRDDKKGFVAGGKIETGKVSVSDEIKFLQNSNEKYRAKILTLRREKSEVKECESGTECGFSLPPHANVAVGDEFIVFKTEYRKRVIS